MTKKNDPTQIDFLTELFNPPKVSEKSEKSSKQKAKAVQTIPAVTKYNYRSAMWTLYILGSFFAEETKQNSFLQEKQEIAKDKITAYKQKVQRPGQKLINLGERAIDCKYQNQHSELRQLQEEINRIPNKEARIQQHNVLESAVALLDKITAEVYRNKRTR